MKAYLAIGITVWLICGFVGLWMLGYDHIDAKLLAKGPFTLAQALSDAPELTRVNP